MHSGKYSSSTLPHCWWYFCKWAHFDTAGRDIWVINIPWRGWSSLCLVFHFGLDFALLDFIWIFGMSVGLIFEKKSIFNSGCATTTFFVRMASQVDFAFILVVFGVNVAIRTIDERTLAATFNFFEFHFDLKYSKKLLKFGIRPFSNRE